MGNGDRKPLRISVDEAHQRKAENGAVILDVVGSESYPDVTHEIEGAVRIDPEDVEEDYKKLPEDQEVLTYCT